MSPWLLGKILSPFFMLLMIWLVTSPCRRMLQQRMKDGALKRLLLRRIS